MYFLPVFFEFFENKRLFVRFAPFAPLGGVPEKHKLWYTLFIHAPDMVHLMKSLEKNRKNRRVNRLFSRSFSLAAV